jgi:hypothetical protein
MTDPVPAPSPGGMGAGPTGTGPSSMMSGLDTAGRYLAGGGAAAIVILLLGIPVGAWEMGGYALVVLVAALVALGIAFVSSPTSPGASWPVPARDIALLAGVVMSVLSVFNVIEVLFDLDQIDDERGGVVGLVLTIGLAAASLTVFLGGVLARRGTDMVGAAGRRSDRGTRLALAGLGLDIVAWLIMLTISVYSLGATGSFGIAASVLAVLVLVLGSDPDRGWRLPIPAAWIAVGISLVAAFTLLDLFSQYNRANDRFGLDAIDSVAFFAHVIAVLLILAGSVVSAVDHQRRIGASTTT